MPWGAGPQTALETCRILKTTASGLPVFRLIRQASSGGPKVASGGAATDLTERSCTVLITLLRRMFRCAVNR